jgi:hypothetical protein
MSQVSEEHVSGLVVLEGWESTVPAQPTAPREVFRQQAVLQTTMAAPDKAHGSAAHGVGEFIWGFASRVRRGASQSYEQHMFYPYLPSQGPEQAAGWCRDVARGLFEATSYQVTAEMVDAVTGVYQKSTDGLFHVEEATLPSPSGFCWLDKPMIITDKWGRKVAERAITWSPVTSRVQYGQDRTDGFGRKVAAQVEDTPGIRLSTWSFIEDDRRLLEEASAAGTLPKDPSGKEGWGYLWEEFDELAKLGDLSLSHTLVVLFGDRHTWSFGKSPHPEEAAGDFRPDNMIAWVYALWMFMGSEIVVTPKTRMDRAALRRSPAPLRQNEVSVVLLRRSRIAPVGSDGPHKEIDWSCRWLVSGHHRHIDSYLSGHHAAVPFKQPGSDHDICAICWRNGEHVRVTWIRPFLKGPETAPLKATKKLMKLAR